MLESIKNNLSLIFRENFINKILSFLIKTLFTVSIFLLLTASFFIKINAEDYTCDLGDTEVNWGNAWNVSNFIPIIPENCATGGDGRARPLSLSLVLDVVVRAYGFGVSVVLNLLVVVFIYHGIRYIMGGIAGGVESARKGMINAIWAIAVMSFFYYAVFISLTILGNADGVNL